MMEGIEKRRSSLANDLVIEPATKFFKILGVGHRRQYNRLVQKSGGLNLSLANAPMQKRKFMRDKFTTLIELKWRYSLLFFFILNMISWTIFYFIYYYIIKAHGDFEHVDDPNWVPCLSNGNSVGNIFIYSIETQTTVGYGFRYPTDKCPSLVLTMCIQLMCGVMFITLMSGVIIAKLARPIKRAATILFSKNAVICMRGGKLCLLMRVGDMRRSTLAEAHVRLQMIKTSITYEGEILPFHQFEMDVGFGNGLDRLCVMWPVIICHEIDERSPLYHVSKQSLKSESFEILVIFEGVVESLGTTAQVRTSYLPNEILWGKRFENLVTYQRADGEYHVNFDKFHSVYDVSTPSCSAKELDERQVAGLKPEKGYQFLSVKNPQTDETTAVCVKRENPLQRISSMSSVSLDGRNATSELDSESEDESSRDDRDDRSTYFTDSDGDQEQTMTVVHGSKLKKTLAIPQDPQALQQVVIKP